MTVEILAVLDRSGSMQTIAQEAIGGFNRFLAEQQEIEGDANLTLVLFDDRVEVPVKSVPIRDVQPLNSQTFVPRGMTATFDAVGKALAELEALNPEKAIVFIITDGGENSSREFTQEAVKAKVTAAEARGWEVIFLAQNLDAAQAGAKLGVRSASTFGLADGAAGIHEGYATMSLSASAYRSK